MSAIAVVLTPASILLMVLFSANGTMRVQGTTMLVSRVIFDLIIVMGFMIFGQYAVNHAQNSDKILAYLSLGLGLMFFFLAIFTWIRRPKPGQKVKVPKWLIWLSKLNPILIIGFNLFNTAISVKNITLMASAASHIAQFTPNWFARFAWASYFSLACVSLLAFIWGMSLFGGSQAQIRVTHLRDWLFKHGSVIIVILYLIIGIYEIYHGYTIIEK